MPILDGPPLPVQAAAPMAFVRPAAPASAAPLRRTIGVCHIVPNGPDHEPESAEFVIEPAHGAEVYFRVRERRDIRRPGKVKLSQAPKHGVLQDEGEGAYRYVPDAGYYGHDQAVMKVEMPGATLKMIYFFQSIQSASIGNTTVSDLCGKRELGWKIE